MHVAHVLDPAGAKVLSAPHSLTALVPSQEWPGAQSVQLVRAPLVPPAVNDPGGQDVPEEEEEEEEEEEGNEDLH